MPYRCYFLEETSRVRIDLRRYHHDGQCPRNPGENSYHDATFDNFMVIESPIPPLGESESYDVEAYRVPKDDSRWPRQCSCGYAFPDEAHWQMFAHRLYRRSDNGTETVLREATPGALYYADWLCHSETKQFLPWDWDNQNEPPLYCKLPNGNEWCIDGRASNCTMPNERTHRCWVRHGEVPNIHVDKNGYTCAAGAGSIASGNYHGFLHNGCLT
jgi:hypothetical protein